METAVLGAGCFWCTEAVYQELKGVSSVLPGYAGGQKPNPTYDEVCAGTTGHAEVAQIEFDPSTISYRDLLTVFFAVHDPTTLNRQGNDVGTQYRSVIFYTTPGQKEEAEKFIKELGPDVVTEVAPLDKFYPAENYHQNYYRDHKDQSYCQVVISPKLEKLEKRFSELLKSE